MMRYQALFVAGYLEVYAFEYYKSDQIVVFDVACLFELRLPVSLRMRSSRAMLKSYPTPSGVVGNTALVL